MAFEISTTREFSAGHRIRLYDGSWEPMHGHNWTVKVTVSAQKLDRIGVVMDFHELERLVDTIIGPWRDGNLNDMPPFADVNPTAENVAMHVGRSLLLPERIKLQSVEVWETATNSAVWRP
jgi:6-pyruvoyltetrahydropterin/6-carboxytetrahydropterin synthase